MGKPAENILQCRAEILMDQTTSETPPNISDIVRAKIDTDQAFYVKAILLIPNPTEFNVSIQKQLSSSDHKYEIIFMLDSTTREPAIEDSDNRKNTSPVTEVEKTNSTSLLPTSSPCVKRSLFHKLDETSPASKKVDKRTTNEDKQASIKKMQ